MGSQTKTQSWLGCMHFPALDASYMYLLQILIVLLCCVNLSVVIN